MDTEHSIARLLPCSCPLPSTQLVAYPHPQSIVPDCPLLSELWHASQYFGHGQGCLDEAQAGDEDPFAKPLLPAAAVGAILEAESPAFGTSLPLEEDNGGGGGGQRHGSRSGVAAAAASDDDDAGASSGSDDDEDGGGGASGSCSDDVDGSVGDDDEDEGDAEEDDSEDGDDADRNRWVPAPLVPLPPLLTSWCLPPLLTPQCLSLPYCPFGASPFLVALWCLPPLLALSILLAFLAGAPDPPCLAG